MGNENGGAACQDELQRLLDLPLCERVDAGGGLVEDEDRRPLDQHAHQGHHLAKTHREAAAAFANLGLQAIGEGFKPFPLPYAAGHALDLRIAQVWLGIADIIRHGP